MIKSITDLKNYFTTLISTNDELDDITIPCLVKKISPYPYTVYIDTVDPKKETNVLRAQISVKNYNNDINVDDIIIVNGFITYGRDLMFQIVSYSKAEKTKTKYEKICEQLLEEGLIKEKKRPPKSILNIGIISSSNASGLKDFLDVVSTLPLLNIYIFNVTLQGMYMERQVIEALNRSSNYDIDVLCIIRGGGSKTDLEWFNNYNIASLISQLSIYTVCGIGHETDYTVTDLVVDKSLTTPTQASYFIKSLVLRQRNLCIDLCQTIENHILTVQQMYKQICLLIENYKLTTKSNNEILLAETCNIFNSVIDKYIVKTVLDQSSNIFTNQLVKYEHQAINCVEVIDDLVHGAVERIDDALSMQGTHVFNETTKKKILTFHEYNNAKKNNQTVVLQFIDGQITI